MGFESPQLPLGLRPRPDRGFDTYVPGPNAEALRALSTLADGPACGVPLVLHGAAGTGKTHLLEACCVGAHRHGRRVAFVPLADPDALEPALLGGLETFEIVCVDDADRVAGRRPWEEALFHLYNGLEAAGASLVVSMRGAPAAAGFALPDLVSRLAAAIRYRLRPLDDDARGVALERHARDLGFELSPAVTAYILARLPRDMPALIAFLDRLDRSSLAAQRQVTLPFVRALLEPASAGRSGGEAR